MCTFKAQRQLAPRRRSIGRAHGTHIRFGSWNVRTPLNQHGPVTTAVRSLGVPSLLVDLIRSFHTDMEACVQTAGGVSDTISVENGLHQGSVMAPVLFNLYFALVLERWRDQLQASKDVGIQVIYKCNGDLFPRLCQRHWASSQSSTVTDMEYTDDAALVALPARLLYMP